MSKPKHEAEQFKAALLAGIRHAEGRGTVEFEATDSASDEALEADPSLAITAARVQGSLVAGTKSWARGGNIRVWKLVIQATIRAG